MNYELKDMSKHPISHFLITSPGIDEKIVVLHLDKDMDILIIRGFEKNVHEVSIPPDSIEAVISALNQIKEKLDQAREG